MNIGSSSPGNIICMAGGGGGGGSRLFMSRLRLQDATVTQRTELNRKKRIVIDLKGELFYNAPSVFRLEQLIREHLQKLFNPSRLLVAFNNAAEFPATDVIVKAALSENRVIYVPDAKGTRLTVSGQVPTKLYDLFSVSMPCFGIETAVLNRREFGSIVVAPLVTGLNQRRPVAEYKRLGAIVLCFEEAEMLDPLIDLIPLRMYADYFAIAFEDKASRR